MSLSIQIDAPFLSIAEYAKRTGQTKAAVTTQVDRGQLPIIKLKDTEQAETDVKKKRSKRFINMVALYKKADQPEFK